MNPSRPPYWGCQPSSSRALVLDAHRRSTSLFSGREVQYRVAVLHGGAHAIGVAHIAREHLELALYVCCAAVEPTPGVEGVVHDKGADFVALPNKGFCQVRADEAVGAGDEDGFHSLLVLECAPDVDKEAVIFFDGISESVTSI